MSPNRLLALLGRYDSDPVMEAALKHYSIRNRPEVQIDKSDVDGPVVETHSWVKNSRAGIEFGFDDEAAWIGLDETAFGKRPMLLTQIYLYGRHEGVLPYKQPLPNGLHHFDNRTTVRNKLIEFEPTRHSFATDTWDTPEYRITVAYSDEENCIGFVLCTLIEPPLPSLGYAIPPAPFVDSMAKLLGCTLSDPAVQLVLGSFGLRERIDEIKETEEADYLNPFGFSIEFSIPIEVAKSSPSSIQLSGITFYHEREQGARQWSGELPFRIQFGDSPETVESKIGRPPDSQYDDAFSGNAKWHEDDLTICIVYDTMQNRVLRVAIYLSPIIDQV